MLNIREARPKDLSQIASLRIAHANYEGIELASTNEYEANLSSLLFEEEPKIWCLVLADNDLLFGYATWTIQYATWTAKSYVYMDCIYLEEGVRGEGYGQQMMDIIHKRAVEEGHEEIQWQTPENNHRAISFYKRLGAKPLKKFRFFWSI